MTGIKQPMGDRFQLRNSYPDADKCFAIAAGIITLILALASALALARRGAALSIKVMQRCNWKARLP